MRLRDVIDGDIDEFFVHHLESSPHAASEPRDEALVRWRDKWAANRSNPANVTRTIVVDERVAGHTASFIRFGLREVSYVLGRDFWGRGIATEALAALLVVVAERPIFARVLKDNPASLRVLEKNGFAVIREETFFSEAHGANVDEFVLQRDRDSGVSVAATRAPRR